MLLEQQNTKFFSKKKAILSLSEWLFIYILLLKPINHLLLKQHLLVGKVILKGQSY